MLQINDNYYKFIEIQRRKIKNYENIFYASHPLESKKK